MRWFDNLRIELRIALAVCVGMLAYKVIVQMAWASWYYGWFGNWKQEQMLAATAGIAIFVSASVWLLRSRRVI